MQPFHFLSVRTRFVSKTSLSLASGVVFAGLFLTAGCNSKRMPDHMAEAAATGERPVAMKGNAQFFDGKVTALVTVSRGFGSGMGSEMAKAGQKNELKPEIDNFTGLEDTSDEARERMYEEALLRERWRRAGGSPMPPVTVRVNLENHGPQALEVEIVEVNSDLGNFAVRPGKLTVAAGQRNQPNPMISQLGVTSDVIPMKVSLRLGGKTESHTILVKNIFTSSNHP